MSQKENSSEHNSEHQSPIKTPQQLITAIVLSFLVPIIGILMIASYITNERSVDTASQAMAPDAIAKRLQPVGTVSLVDANAPKVAKTGEEIYKTVCSACHGTGAAGAPKVGDVAGWTARLKAGQKTVVENAVKGLKAMPPRGGSPDLSDADVERAVVHMANQSGGKFKEPAVAK